MSGFNWDAVDQKVRSKKADLRANRELGFALNIKAHKFTVFRLGEDVCAKCGKPRKEHPHE